MGARENGISPTSGGSGGEERRALSGEARRERDAALAILEVVAIEVVTSSLRGSPTN